MYKLCSDYQIRPLSLLLSNFENILIQESQIDIRSKYLWEDIMVRLQTAADIPQCQVFVTSGQSVADAFHFLEALFHLS